MSVKFRKKPVVIEAFQWNSTKQVEDWPDWAQTCAKIDKLQYLNTHSGESHLVVKTLEGLMKVSENDWIIKGVNGEIYPCKPDIFKKTYERVE